MRGGRRCHRSVAITSPSGRSALFELEAHGPTLADDRHLGGEMKTPSGQRSGHYPWLAPALACPRLVDHPVQLWKAQNVRQYKGRGGTSS